MPRQLPVIDDSPERTPKVIAERMRARALGEFCATGELMSGTWNAEAMSHRGIRTFVSSGSDLSRVAVISIVGKGDGESRPSFPVGLPVLRSHFNDIIQTSSWNRRAILFSTRHAHRIMHFVEHLPPDIERLIVHCWHGQGRSRSVVAALKRLRGEDDLSEFIEGSPNPLVYRTMLDVAQSRACKRKST